MVNESISKKRIKSNEYSSELENIKCIDSERLNHLENLLIKIGDNKKYLHLISFVIYQYYFLQDLLIDILLSTTKTTSNTTSSTTSSRMSSRTSW